MDENNSAVAAVRQTLPTADRDSRPAPTCVASTSNLECWTWTLKFR